MSTGGSRSGGGRRLEPADSLRLVPARASLVLGPARLPAWSRSGPKSTRLSLEPPRASALPHLQLRLCPRLSRPLSPEAASGWAAGCREPMPVASPSSPGRPVLNGGHLLPHMQCSCHVAALSLPPCCVPSIRPSPVPCPALSLMNHAAFLCPLLHSRPSHSDTVCRVASLWLLTPANVLLVRAEIERGQGQGLGVAAGVGFCEGRCYSANSIRVILWPLLLLLLLLLFQAILLCQQLAAGVQGLSLPHNAKGPRLCEVHYG